jgi:hypothetical protein
MILFRSEELARSSDITSSKLLALECTSSDGLSLRFSNVEERPRRGLKISQMRSTHCLNAWMSLAISENTFNT